MRMPLKLQSLVFVFGIFPVTVFPQTELWQEVPEIFNPSGVEIDSINFRFQFLDWNEDSYLDIILNQNGQLEYLEHSADKTDLWMAKELDLPEIRSFGVNWPWSYVTNFCINDIDKDGDWDIISDSLYVYRNNGSNEAPVWQIEKNYFEGRIEPVIVENDTVIPNFNLRFLDLDGDGDSDFLASPGPDYEFGLDTHYLFKYSKETDRWHNLSDFLGPIQYGGGSVSSHLLLADVDNDMDLDACRSFKGILGSDVRTLFGFEFYLNSGDNLEPAWVDYPTDFFWPEPDLLLIETDYEIYGQFIDFSANGRHDYLFSAPNRNIKLIENKTTNPDEWQFEEGGTFIGRLNVESDAQPFLLAQDDSVAPLLVVSENYEDWYFSSEMFSRFYGRLRTLGPWDSLNHNYKAVETWFANARPSHAEVKSDYFVSFCRLAETGKMAMAVSYLWEELFDVKGYKVEFYQNQAKTMDNPFWQADTILLAHFDLSPDNFNKPYLIDLDDDGTLELFIKKGGLVTSYRNTGSLMSPDWRETPSLLTGIDDLERYHLTFADLDNDLDQDIVFGNKDGTLSYFENLGAENTARWRESKEVVAGIDVGRNAAPVFGDIDRDSDLDLIVGNQSGFLYYYQNQTVVRVENHGESTPPPTTYVLAQNYPNPFNPVTIIEFSLQRSGMVTLKVFNLKGQAVATLVDHKLDAGSYAMRWDASGFSTGLYVYQLQAGRFVQARKLLLVK